MLVYSNNAQLHGNAAVLVKQKHLTKPTIINILKLHKVYFYLCFHVCKHFVGVVV